MRSVKTGKWVPFRRTLIVFTQTDGKWFMLIIIAHQANEFYQYLHFNITLEWIFQYNPSRYMDIDEWLKATTQLSNVCGAYPTNNYIFFDKNDSQFDDRALLF